jgi:predicted nucleic-acid-binding Zn-ribbon protein
LSTEHDYYSITCKGCGHTGSLDMATSDYGAADDIWVGFTPIKTILFNPAKSWVRCDKCGLDGDQIEIARAKQ